MIRSRKRASGTRRHCPLVETSICSSATVFIFAHLTNLSRSLEGRHGRRVRKKTPLGGPLLIDSWWVAVGLCRVAKTEDLDSGGSGYDFAHCHASGQCEKQSEVALAELGRRLANINISVSGAFPLLLSRRFSQSSPLYRSKSAGGMSVLRFRGPLASKYTPNWVLSGSGVNTSRFAQTLLRPASGFYAHEHLRGRKRPKQGRGYVMRPAWHDRHTANHGLTVLVLLAFNAVPT
jgi:hypothetical protein